jgi:hypothetical protein
MALEISTPASSSHHSFTDDDPEYWFLYPYFEAVHLETGVMIDLYDRANFEGGQLLELILMLERAEAAVQKQPETWDVAITADPIPQMRAVRNSTLLATISKLKQMANDSNNEGAPLVCFGD